jgi:hypothetical protein
LRRRRPWGTLVELHLFDNMKTMGKPGALYKYVLRLTLKKNIPYIDLNLIKI